MSDPIPYMSTTDVAKALRKELKQQYPGHSFSVRSSSFAGGSAIDITWTDGPTTAQIEELAGEYESRGFDGMIDLQYSYTHARLPDGRIVRTGTDGTIGSGGSVPAWHTNFPGAVPVRVSCPYLHYHRHISEARLRWALAQMIEQRYIIAGDFEIAPGSSGDGWIISPSVRWTLTPETAANWGYTDMLDRELSTLLDTNFYQPAAPQPTTAAPAGEMTITEEGSWLWVAFPCKPADDVIARLKELGARWSKKRAAWYLTDSSMAGAVMALA